MSPELHPNKMTGARRTPPENIFENCFLVEISEIRAKTPKKDKGVSVGYGES
jgi:hypothetical protein